MKRVLLKLTALCAPLGILLPMVWGWFTPGYASLSQQMSELELLHGSAALATRTGALLCGLSIVAFAFALLLRPAERMPFTAGSALVFGVSMMSNGVFVMGGPLHGLYGIGFACVLTPAFFVAEFPRDSDTPGRDRLSLLTAVLCLVYMWLMVTRLDPAAERGLTQRLASIPLFGWYSYAAIKLLAYVPCRSVLRRTPIAEAIG
jgi:hypothetical protein